MRYSSNGTEVYDGDLADSEDPTIATATSYAMAALIAIAMNRLFTDLQEDK